MNLDEKGIMDLADKIMLTADASLDSYSPGRERRRIERLIEDAIKRATEKAEAENRRLTERVRELEHLIGQVRAFTLASGSDGSLWETDLTRRIDQALQIRGGNESHES